jgi:hypothetical protein
MCSKNWNASCTPEEVRMTTAATLPRVERAKCTLSCRAAMHTYSFLRSCQDRARMTLAACACCIDTASLQANTACSYCCCLWKTLYIRVRDCVRGCTSMLLCVLVPFCFVFACACLHMCKCVWELCVSICTHTRVCVCECVYACAC